VIFLIGMAGAGLADIVDIRLLIIVASSLLFVSAAFTLFAPGLGYRTWRTAAARLAPAAGAPVMAALPYRAATLADFDRLIGRLPTFARLADDQRAAFVRDATIREVPAGTRVLEHGDVASNAYFILEGVASAGVPEEDGSYRGLSTMQVGDFFGEIAAPTSSPIRTASCWRSRPNPCARRWSCRRSSGSSSPR
jgi:hypothetical protein